MAQRERHTDEAEKTSASYQIPPELATMGIKPFEELVAIQSEQLKKLQEVVGNCFDRMQSEATLTSEFAAKLTAARSIPEVATACQGWTNHHMEMAVTDAKRIFADVQQLAEAGVRLWSNGWRPNGHGAVST